MKSLVTHLKKNLKDRKYQFAAGVIVIALATSGYFLSKSPRPSEPNNPVNSITEQPISPSDQSTDKKQPPALTSMSDTFLGNFSDVRDVLSVDNTTWLASFGSLARIKDGQYKFYTQKNGLSTISLNDMVLYKNQLWVSGQGGVARYDSKKDSFTSYLHDQSNSELYVDPYTGKLYVATFIGLFEYDSEKNTFSQASGDNAPSRSGQVAFTKDKIIVSASNHPIKIQDKKTSKWEAQTPAEFTDSNNNLSSLSLLTANERVFVYGRDRDYDGCDSHGKAPASLFFELKESGWQRNEELTKQFTLIDELIVGNNIEDSPKTLSIFQYTDPCSDNKGKWQSLTADFTKTPITFSTPQNVTQPTNIGGSRSLTEKGKLLAATHDTLLKLTGYSSNKELQAIDSQGNLFMATGNTVTYGSSANPTQFSVFSPTSSGYKEKVIIPSSEKLILFDTYICQKDNQTTHRYVLGKDDSWQGIGDEVGEAVLYKVKDDQTTEIVTRNVKDLLGMLPESKQATCIDNKLYWLDRGLLYRYDFTDTPPTPLTKSAPSDQINDTDSSSAIDPSGRFWLYDKQTRKLYRYDAGGVPAEVNIDSVRTSLIEADPKSFIYSSLILATDTGLWWLQNKTGNNGPGWQMLVSSTSGKLLKEFTAGDSSTALKVINEDYVIGFEDGEFAKHNGGFFKINRRTFAVKKFARNDLPTSISLHSPTYFLDQRFSKVWFDTDSTFSVDLKELIKL